MNDAPLPAELPDDVTAISRIAAIPTILDVVCRTTGMGFVAIAHVTEHQWIACSVQDSIGFGLNPGDELPVETTICDEIRQHGRAVVIDDVAADPDFCGHRTPALYKFRSYISMPIVLPDGSFFGTLCALDPKPRHLNTKEIVGAFSLYAELIAFHLDANQRLAKSEASLVREREVAELREQFIAVLGHDLRNPLAAVSAGTRLLLRHPERAAEIAGHMRQSINRMAGLIDNIMDFARGRLGGGLPVSRDTHEPLAPVLEQVVHELQSIHPDRAIDLDIDLAQPVSVDRARIAQLLSNLLANALTHGHTERPVQVSARSDDGGLTLTVANEGPAIAAPQQESLFQPFFRGAVRESQQGLGLGLYIAAEIAKAHGGTLEVASTPAQTVFTFAMPAHI
jgi:signal transduction histidine kinase